ncbi:MAG: hypothetical protein ABID61_03465, partial [Candidatus Micrarchaeota archaeon]
MNRLQHGDISRTAKPEGRDESKKGWFSRKVLPLISLVTATVGFGTACTIGIEPNPQPTLTVFDGGVPNLGDSGQDTSVDQDAGGTTEFGSDGGSADGGTCIPPRPLSCDLMTQVGSALVSDYIAVPL